MLGRMKKGSMNMVFSATRGVPGEDIWALRVALFVQSHKPLPHSSPGPSFAGVGRGGGYLRGTLLALQRHLPPREAPCGLGTVRG